MRTDRPAPPSRRLLVLSGLIPTLACAAALTGCGGGAMSAGKNPSPTPTPASKTVVQVEIGDSPADWMLAFSMNITTMSLTGSGSSATVVSASTPIEMMHLMGVMQPLAMISVPQGTYTGASITIGSATVMYIDPTTRSPMQKTISGPIAGSVTFSAPVTVGSTPMAMGFDLDLAASVTADTSGNLHMNPVFHVISGNQGSGSPMDFADGGIQQMMGAISSVSGSSFVMSSMQASQMFTFATNSSTAFDGGSMTSMQNGMLVMVDAMFQSDGSLMATRVQSMMNSGGMMGGGIVTAVSGQPATTLTLVLQNGAGTGMMGSDFGNGVTADLSASTTFTINDDNIDMAGLPFPPAFDSSHIYAGQNVMPISSSGMMGGMGGGMMGGSSMAGTIMASRLVLMPQGLTGTVATAVASGATASFSLALPSDCAFTTMTGATSVTVFQQSATTVSGTSPIAAGSSAHAFGLLFYDSGQWKMVASRMNAN
ncbi:MAG TPA: DUF5666 domain-containing protein [Terracidiphilus sp.]|nr:DUF5666 domain-containing protein [Terracidiphilus sp.]